jgi:hypothetical protein
MLPIRAPGPSRSLAASPKRPTEPSQMAAIATRTRTDSEALGRRMVVQKFEPLSPFKFMLVLIHRVWSGPRASGPSAGPGSEDHGPGAAAVPPRLSEGTAGLPLSATEWQ